MEIEQGGAGDVWASVVGPFVQQHGELAFIGVVLTLALLGGIVWLFFRSRYSFRMVLSRGNEKRIVEVLPDLPIIGTEEDVMNGDEEIGDDGEEPRDKNQRVS